MRSCCQTPSECFLVLLHVHTQITMIVWQKLSSAREVLVEQELGDVLLAGGWVAGQLWTVAVAWVG